MPTTTASPGTALAREQGLARGPVPLHTFGCGFGRAFGHAAADLEHDFDSDDRPGLVTALLAACSAGAEAGLLQHWWQAPVGLRISALLDLAAMSMPRGPASTLVIALRCEQEACGARFDIELPASAWSRPETTNAPVMLARESGAAPLLLRHPTGEDLSDCRQWALQNTAPAQIANALLQRLCLAGMPPPDDEAAMADIAAALAEADPLVDFAVHCACPECGTAADRAIDLEAQALQVLAARQRALMREVHGLATHYGWTEREIFEVPAARRSRYLAAIAADAADAEDAPR